MATRSATGTRTALGLTDAEPNRVGLRRAGLARQPGWLLGAGWLRPNLRGVKSYPIVKTILPLDMHMHMPCGCAAHLYKRHALMVARHYMDMERGSPFPIRLKTDRAHSLPSLRPELGVASLLLHQQIGGGGVVEVSVAQ